MKYKFIWTKITNINYIKFIHLKILYNNHLLNNKCIIKNYLKIVIIRI